MKKLFLSLVLAAALIAGGLASFNPDAPPSANKSQTSQEQTQTDTGPQDQTETPTESSGDQDDSSSPGAGGSPETEEAPTPEDGPPTLVGGGSFESGPGGLQEGNSSKQSRPEKTAPREARPESPSKQTRDNYNAVLGKDRGSGDSPEMSAEEYNQRVDTLYRQQRSNYETIIDDGS